MTKNDLFNYYLITGTEALETLEKILKGLVFKNTNTHAPPIHDLAKLAQKAGINKVPSVELEEMTTWNIQARYDTVKRDFYQKANKEYSKKWFAKTKEFFLWIKNQY